MRFAANDVVCLVVSLGVLSSEDWRAASGDEPRFPASSARTIVCSSRNKGRPGTPSARSISAATGHRANAPGRWSHRDIVITAAHCVVNSATGRAFPLDDIHFLAAVRSSENKGHSTASCLHFPEGHPLANSGETIPRPAGGRVPLSALANDSAVIVLNEALGVEPALLAEKRRGGART